MTKTILVVDDDPSIVRLVQINLERQGYRVVTAGDGRRALEKLAVELPAMVVTDVEMPYMDGFELIKALKNNPALCDIPIIMLTAKAMEADIFESVKSAVDCYLAKPISPSKLVAAARRILEPPSEATNGTTLQP